MNDSLQRFLFEDSPIRGELVRLNTTWQAILENHDYPPAVRAVLGEAMAATALLSATMKFDGIITLQITGDGPISMLVVECANAQNLRGLAHSDGDISEDATLTQMFGSGRLILTIDPRKGKERYQGIVELEGDSLADALANYLARSEQLPTRLWLAADAGQATGLLLQELPAEEKDEELWNRVSILAETISHHELLHLDQSEVIRRLFHEEDVRIFEPTPLSFRCSCSRERVAAALRGLGLEEVRSIIADEGSIKVNCEFCNKPYEFDAVDAEALFTEQPQPESPATRQ